MKVELLMKRVARLLIFTTAIMPISGLRAADPKFTNVQAGAIVGTTGVTLSAAQQAALNSHSADITALGTAVSTAKSAMSSAGSAQVGNVTGAASQSAAKTAYSTSLTTLQNAFIAAMDGCTYASDGRTVVSVKPASGTVGTVCSPLLQVQTDLTALAFIATTASNYPATVITALQGAITAALSPVNGFPIAGSLLSSGYLTQGNVGLYATINPKSGNGALGAALIALKSAYTKYTVPSNNNSGSSGLSTGDIVGAAFGGDVLIAGGFFVGWYAYLRFIGQNDVEARATIKTALNNIVNDLEKPLNGITPADLQNGIESELKPIADAANRPAAELDIVASAIINGRPSAAGMPSVVAAKMTPPPTPSEVGGVVTSVGELPADSVSSVASGTLVGALKSARPTVMGGSTPADGPGSMGGPGVVDPVAEFNKLFAGFPADAGADGLVNAAKIAGVSQEQLINIVSNSRDFTSVLGSGVKRTAVKSMLEDTDGFDKLSPTELNPDIASTLYADNLSVIDNAESAASGTIDDLVNIRDAVNFGAVLDTNQVLYLEELYSNLIQDSTLASTLKEFTPFVDGLEG